MEYDLEDIISGVKNGIEKKKQEYALKKKKQEENQKKIERLNIAREKIKREKESARERKKEIYSIGIKILENRRWYGNEFDHTILAVEDLRRAYQSYINNIDKCLDSLCDEITHLENENMQLGYDSLKIGSFINDQISNIEKMYY